MIPLKFTYLLIDLGCIIVPFLGSFYKPRAFYKEWKYYIPANILIALIFLIWDVLFTEAGIWGFNPKYLSGLYIYNLPLEEVLFFICIPYACVYTWFAFKYLIRKNPFSHIHRYLTIFLIITLVVIGFLSITKWYTTVTFLSTGIYLFYLYIKKEDLSWIYLAYIAILPFFLFSNGMLTGSLLEEPIVWYNNSENLNFRIGTIPLEDSIYGFLLILLNIRLYEKLKSYYGKQKKAVA